MANPRIGGRALKKRFRAGVDCLARNVDRINLLNVFPVPDGDTGVNMYHTLQRAWQEIEPLESDDLSLVAERFAYGALMGARGNSGTILSQLLKGFADGLAKAAILTPERLAAACDAAAKQGYASVSLPTEGTILTVAREAAESLRRCEDKSETLAEMLERLTSAARASLANTPNLLPILKDADVVDAGGMGLVCFLEGMKRGRAQPETVLRQPASNASPLAAAAADYGYDVQFLMIGEGLDIGQTRRDLETMGWSVIVVGDDRLIKAHIHVDNPALPLDYAIQAGAALDDVVVENMTRQFQRAQASRRPAPIEAASEPLDLAVIAVVEGDGLRAVFRDLNCSAIIEGGGGRNPAAEDFIRAIEKLNAAKAILLPNDSNIVMAARQAADMIEGRQAQVVATESALQGINAMIAFGDAADGELPFEALVARMREAGARTRTIAITRAARSTRFRKLKVARNDFISLVDGALCSNASDIATVALEAFAQLDARDLELATVYYGAGVSALESERLIRRLRECVGGLEFEAVYGGQSLYPYLISVE